MEQTKPICKDYTQVSTGKGCVYYNKTKKNKIGLCGKQCKLTFLCHYSEKVIGTYTGDSEICSIEEL